MDTALAAAVGFLLVVVAFRRARGVIAPPPGRSLARPRPEPDRWAGYRRRVVTVLVAVRVALGVVAVASLAVLARHLFD